MEAEGGQWESRRLREILNQLSDAVVVADREFRFVHANDAALRMVNRSLDEIVGTNHWDLLPHLRGKGSTFLFTLG